MSVEITGPKGYEWQYKATCLIALQNPDCDSLVVEGIGGEDAQLKYNDGTETKNVEIQAKSSQSDIDLTVLCDWICHFPSNKSTNSLLSRLASATVRILFVAGGRCNDATRQFIIKLGDLSTQSAITKETCNLFLQALDDYTSNYPKSTPLKKARQQSLNSLARELKRDRASLKQALSRILIWESVTANLIKEELIGALTKNHRVPRSECEYVILLLEDAIREARDNRADVSGKVSKIIFQKSSLALLGDEPHFALGNESNLLCRLQDDNSLLLKGRSQCGKTNMAKFLAQSLQEEGVNGVIGFDFAEAARFLTERNEEPRLYLLEDPFENRDSADVLKVAESVRRLRGGLSKHRFLIVTSTSEKTALVLHLLPKEEWVDTTVSDWEILMKLWENRFKNDQRLRELEGTLRSGLAQMPPDQLPQFGHLLHLSRISGIEEKSFEEMMEIARFDIGSLAQGLTERGKISREIHTALRIGASTTQRIGLNDLAFILSDSEERPGYDEALGWSIGGGSNNVRFPEATPSKNLASVYLDELEYIEALGYIRGSAAGIEFAHPDYYAVSTKVLAAGSEITLPDRLGILDRGLSSLNETVAKSSAATLPLFYRVVGNSENARHLVFEVGKRAMRSIFPGVRDIVMDAIIDWLPTLTPDDRKTGMTLITNDDAYSYGEIKWEDQVPWTSMSRSWEDLYVSPEMPNPAELETLLNLIVSGESNRGIRPREAWDLVYFIESNLDLPQSSVALSELLKQSHAFIRAKAIVLLIKKEIGSPEVYLELLRDERSPSVICAAISQCFHSWQHAEDQERQILRDWILQAFGRVPTAVVCSKLLVDFGDPFSSGTPNYERLDEPDRQSLWNLWAELIQIYLRTVASQPFRHNGAHMYLSLTKACEHINSRVFQGVIESWADWIVGQLEMRILDDYELAAAGLLLTQVESGESRERLISGMLNHRDTGFVVTTVHHMVENWGILSTTEKALLLDALDSDRIDARWLRATAISRDEVPPAIQALLSNDKELLLGAAESIMKMLHPELLSDSLHVFCGQPQPLWWYGLHHQAKGVWMSVLSEVLRDPSHRDFDLALAEVFDGMSFSPIPGGDERVEVWRDLCLGYGTSMRSRLFEHLLHVSVRVSGPRLPGFWSFLLSAAEGNNEREEYLNRIIENIDQISLNVDDLAEFFGITEFDKFIWPRMHPEKDFARILRRLQLAPDGEEAEKVFADLVVALSARPPRLAKLHKVIEPLLSRFETVDTNAVRDAAKAAWHVFVDSAFEKKKATGQEVEIWDWVTACA